LANSVAAHCAQSDLNCYVFIPANLESQKIIGSLVFNPTVVAVNGNYDDVNRLCSEIANDLGWAFVNINIRPYYAEGSKTLALNNRAAWLDSSRCHSSPSGKRFAYNKDIQGNRGILQSRPNR